jgi:hypothetical protein
MRLACSLLLLVIVTFSANGIDLAGAKDRGPPIQ